MLVVSFAWMAVVEATPASQRPYVGSSTDNTELGLTFSYNGFGRVGGQTGGPGQIPVGAGGVARKVTPGKGAGNGEATKTHTAPASSEHDRAAAQRPRTQPDRLRRTHRTAAPVRQGPRRPGRLDAAVRVRRAARVRAARARLAAPRRTRRRRARAPGRCCSCSAAGSSSRRPCSACPRGSCTPTTSRRSAPASPRWPAPARTRSPTSPGGATGACCCSAPPPSRPCRCSSSLLHKAALHGVVHRAADRGRAASALAAAALAMLVQRRASALAVALLLGVLLIAPGVYSATNWLAPVQSTFPAAGPRQAAGPGGYGVDSQARRRRPRAARATSTRIGPGTRWALLGDASNTVSPMILLGGQRRRAGRLQRHRPGARRPRPGAAGRRGAGSLRGARRRVLHARRQRRDRRGRSAPAGWSAPAPGCRDRCRPTA